jgi:hypothetical protein
MSESNLLSTLPPCRGSGRRACRDVLLIVAAALITLRPGQASADEKLLLTGARLTPDFGGSSSSATPFAPRFVLPATYQVSDAPEASRFSTQDFRPRRRSIFDDTSDEARLGDQPMLRGTTVWQRLKDFRSQGRVCLLTLWETGGSSVSLQAGKKGEPSLQWTSHAMNRGGATRGVFDQWFSTSIARASRGMHANSGGPAQDGVGRTPKAADNGPKR